MMHAVLKASLVACLLAMVALVSGCTYTDRVSVGGKGSVKPYDPSVFGLPDQGPATNAATAAPLEYRIGALDTVGITVFQIPDVSGERQVNFQGDVELPLLGTVHLAGLTAAEARGVIERQLGQKYLQSPQVDVVVNKALGQRVTLDGSVEKPGIYPLQGPTTLIQAIAMANGLKGGAIPSRVAVFRTIKGERMAAGFDLRKIRKGLMVDPPIYGNDIIVVDGSTTRQDLRDALRTVPILALFGIL